MRRPFCFSLLVCVALFGQPALSQVAETSAENAQASEGAPVDDPLLAPAPRATTEVASWQEARALLESQATDLQAAVAAVARAEARSRQALAGVLPSARLQGGVGFDVVNPQVPALGIVGAGGAAIAVAAGRAGTPTQPVGGMALTGTVPIVDIASWMNMGSAEAGVQSASFTEADVRRRLVQSLSRLLVSVVAAERAADLNRSGLRLALERAALTTRLEQLGAAVSLDVVRIQQDVEVARTALLGGDEQLFRTREALAQLLGVEGQAGVATTFDVRGLVDDVGGSCSVVVRHERDDVVSARKAAEQARGSRDQTLWGYAPRFDLTTSAAALTTTTGPALGTWSIGAVVSLPLWEGGNREGVLDERNAAIVQAEASVEAVRRTVDVEIGRAGRYEGTARALYETALRSRDLAARADHLTRRSFEIGRVGSLELVQTANVLRQAELVLAAREFDWAQARLDSFLTTARCAP